MSISEILGALQAGIVYLTMCIIDQSLESEETSLELFTVMQVGRLFLY